MKLRWNDMEFEGTMAEIQEFVASMDKPRENFYSGKFNRLGRQVVVCCEDQTVSCRSISDAVRYLRDHGYSVSNWTIGANLKKIGQYSIGKYVVREKREGGDQQ